MSTKIERAKRVLKEADCVIIGAGEFRFSNKRVAEIAVNTVTNFWRKHPDMRVVCNVFKERTLKIY